MSLFGFDWAGVRVVPAARSVFVTLIQLELLLAEIVNLLAAVIFCSQSVPPDFRLFFAELESVVEVSGGIELSSILELETSCKSSELANCGVVVFILPNVIGDKIMIDSNY